MNQSSEANADNPYQSPQKDLEKQESNETGARRRFRKRLIPATLLWSISPLILLGYVVAAGIVLFVNIRYRWIEPNLESLKHLNQRVLSPPVVAHCVFAIAGAVCGIIAASAWMRGRWRRAVLLTSSFLLLMVLAGYVSSGMTE